MVSKHSCQQKCQHPATKRSWNSALINSTGMLQHSPFPGIPPPLLPPRQVRFHLRCANREPTSRLLLCPRAGLGRGDGGLPEHTQNFQELNEMHSFWPYGQVNHWETCICTSLWRACKDLAMCLNLQLLTLLALKVSSLIFKILFSSQYHAGCQCKSRWLPFSESYIFLLARNGSCCRDVWADGRRASLYPTHWSSAEQSSLQQGEKRKQYI